MMVDRTDINHLPGMTTFWASLRLSVGLLLRHASYRLRHPRGSRLVTGNTLVVRLLCTLSSHSKVSLLLNTAVTGIERLEQCVDAITLVQDGTSRSVQARGGVVLASSGFNRHAGLCQTMLPGANADWCPAAPGHTGEPRDLARELGAHYGIGGDTGAFWAPVLIRTRADGSRAV